MRAGEPARTGVVADLGGNRSGPLEAAIVAILVFELIPFLMGIMR